MHHFDTARLVEFFDRENTATGRAGTDRPDAD
jgi:hypothetical protein